ncbi:MAG: hypothetical protein CVT90_00870, partial [Candidatus Altiarchaeales archaeon HGW-Altiarchaeales-3]
SLQTPQCNVVYNEETDEFEIGTLAGATYLLDMTVTLFSTCTFKFDAKIDEYAIAGNYTNNATATGYTTDGEPVENQTANETIEVLLIPVEITKTVNGYTHYRDDTIIFTLIVRYAGDFTLDKLLVTDMFPSYFHVSKILVGGTNETPNERHDDNYGQPGYNDSQLTLTLKDVPSKPEERYTHITIEGFVDCCIPEGNISDNNTGYGDGQTKETDLKGNPHKLHTKSNTVDYEVIVKKPHLNVTKTVNPAVAEQGGRVTYNVSVENSGNGTGQDMTLIDVLHENLTYLISNEDDISKNCNITSFNITHNPDNSSTLTINFTKISNKSTCWFSYDVMVDMDAGLNDCYQNFAESYDQCYRDYCMNSPNCTSGSCCCDECPGYGNGTSPCLAVQQVQPNFTITKDVEPEVMCKGSNDKYSNATYTLNLTNNGNGTARNVTINDTIPAGLYYLIFNGDDISSECDIISYEVTSNLDETNYLTIYLGDVGIGKSCIFTYSVIATPNSPPGNYTNTVTATSINDAFATDNATLAIRSVDVIIKKKIVETDQGIKITLAVENVGECDAYHVEILDDFPPGWIFDYTTRMIKTYPGGSKEDIKYFILVGDPTKWMPYDPEYPENDLPELLPGESISVEFYVMLTDEARQGNNTDHARVDYEDLGGYKYNSTDNDSYVIRTPMDITKTVNESEVVNGDIVTYTIYVKNPIQSYDYALEEEINFPGGCLYNLTITDLLPPTWTFVETTGVYANLTYPNNTALIANLPGYLEDTLSADNPQWTILQPYAANDSYDNAFCPGSELWINFTARAGDFVPVDGIVYNKVNVTGVDSDGNLWVMSDDVVGINVSEEVFLDTVKTILNKKEEYNIGDTIEFMINVSDTYASNLYNVTVVDYLPCGLTVTNYIVVHNNSQYTCEITGTSAGVSCGMRLLCKFDTLLGRNYTLIYLNATVDDEINPGQHINYVKADGYRKNKRYEKHDFVEFSIEVIPMPGQVALNIFKESLNTTANPGDNVTYRITVTNTGTETLNNIRVNDIFPKGWEFGGMVDEGCIENWKYRMCMDVNAAGYNRTNYPLNYTLNFTELLNTAGCGDTPSCNFDINSIRVIESHANNSPMCDDDGLGLTFEFNPAAGYNSSANAVGTVHWMMNGTTPADSLRYYCIYFGTTDEPVSATSYSNYPYYWFNYNGVDYVYEHMLPVNVTTDGGDAYPVNLTLNFTELGFTGVDLNSIVIVDPTQSPDNIFGENLNVNSEEWGNDVPYTFATKTINILNNSQTSTNVSFVGANYTTPVNNLTYLRVPMNATIRSATMNLTGYKDDDSDNYMTRPTLDIGNSGDIVWNDSVMVANNTNDTYENSDPAEHKKIQDDPGFDVTIINSYTKNNDLIVEFYHNSENAQPVTILGLFESEYQLSNNIAQKNENITLIIPDWNNRYFKLKVGNNSEVYEFGITVITVQSYPVVGGNWTVEFNTTGIADLWITAVNETTWSNDN